MKASCIVVLFATMSFYLFKYNDGVNAAPVISTPGVSPYTHGAYCGSRTLN